MKKPKPKFSGKEIQDLLQQVRTLNDDLLDYDELSVVTESLSEFALLHYEETHDEEYVIDAHQSIAAHAHSLECQAKALRLVVRAFTKPIRDVPKDMGHTDKIIAQVASWRLKLGR